MYDFLESVIGLGSPEEGFRILVMHGDVVLDSADQFGNTPEDAAIQPIRGNTAEEALDHVKPRSGGWREMHMEARMLFQECRANKSSTE